MTNAAPNPATNPDASRAAELSPDAAIAVRGLTYAVDARPILRDVSFTVAPGEYLAVVGPNGAGKTTLIKCLDGLLKAERGDVRIGGRPLTAYRRRDLARIIGYVPQADSSAWPFTVEQFVLMGRYPYLHPLSPPTHDDRAAVAEALERTGTTPFADRLLPTLSSGERQRVLIAAALAQGAEILLLDEPTTFLDYRHQAEVRELLTRMNREGGATIVAVTHDVSAAALEAHRVLALRDGAVAFCGAPAELMRPATLAEVFGTPLLLVPHPHAPLSVVVPGLCGDRR